MFGMFGIVIMGLICMPPCIGIACIGIIGLIAMFALVANPI